MCPELIYSRHGLHSVINKLFQWTNTDNVALRWGHKVKYIPK
jgi:hypothetical protein